MIKNTLIDLKSIHIDKICSMALEEDTSPSYMRFALETIQKINEDRDYGKIVGKQFKEKT